MVFLDTNILLYALEDSAKGRKAAIAGEILQRGDLFFSIQVFQEFYVQATHSRRVDPLTHDEATGLIEVLASHRVIENTYSTLQTALALKKRHGISFWDASILAAANKAECRTLYSEDLNHGQRYGAVTVTNPFL